MNQHCKPAPIPAAPKAHRSAVIGGRRFHAVSVGLAYRDLLLTWHSHVEDEDPEPDHWAAHYKSSDEHAEQVLRDLLATIENRFRTLALEVHYHGDYRLAQIENRADALMGENP